MGTTRFGLDGYGVRRAGSFAGKAFFIAPMVTPITRLGPDGYGVRRAGSFAGKIHARVVALATALSVEQAQAFISHVTWISSRDDLFADRERRRVRVAFEERRVRVRGELRAVRVNPIDRSEAV